MQEIIESARSALHERNWYAALTVAITLPDVCIGCEGIDNHERRFVEFFERYLKSHYQFERQKYVDPHEFGIFEAINEFKVEGLSPDEISDKVAELYKRRGLYNKAQRDSPLEILEMMNGDDLYGFRCALIHEGQSNIDRTRGSRRSNRVLSHFVLVAPDGSSTIHCNGGGEGKPLQIQVDIFCEQLIAGAEIWLETKGQEPEVQEILKRTLRILRANGPEDISF